MNRSPSMAAGGFTLIEILLASIAGALILAALYGVFQHAMKMRDSDTSRIHDVRLRARAANVIRDDLRNALVSGGLFAGIVEGDTAGTDGQNSAYPGYLKFTTTTARDTPDALYGDVQQVEYYIIADTTGTSAGGGGVLVRAVTRDLLDTDSMEQAQEQQILSGVESLQVSFYDGANWQSSWEFNTADNSSTGSSGSSTSGSSASTSGSSGNTETLPEAIRVDIQQAAPTAGGSPPPPLEIMVPWTTQPFISPTPSPSASPS